MASVRTGPGTDGAVQRSPAGRDVARRPGELELEPGAGMARSAPAPPQQQRGSPGGPHALYSHSGREAELLLRAGSGSAPARARTAPGRHGLKTPSPWAEEVPAPPPSPGPGPRPGNSARRRPAAPPGNAGTVSAAPLPLSLPHPSLFLPANGRAGSDACVPRDARVWRRWHRGRGCGGKGLRAGTGGLPCPGGPA